MGRPRKPRFVDGLELPDNLYTDPKKRKNYWRYIRPDGSILTFRATTVEAIRQAKQANRQRDLFKHQPAANETLWTARAGSLLDRYTSWVAWTELNHPKQATASRWAQKRRYVERMCEQLQNPMPNELTLAMVREWWESQDYHPQRNSRAALRSFINHLMLEGVVPKLPFNPFNTSDEAPKLIPRQRPPKVRQRLTITDFWRIHDKAGELGYEGLQIAMELSLLTTMRRGDVCSLRLDMHVTEVGIDKGVEKSISQRGEERATYLRWSYSKHPGLRRVINRAHHLSLNNYRCPFAVSYPPKRRQPRAKQDEHWCRLMPSRISNQFKEARDAAGVREDLPSNAKPTFHEIRALASHLLKKSGHSPESIAEICAHTDAEITENFYLSGHEREYIDVGITIDPKLISRK
ncbi:tyrosine-type recombinase/integrase [Microbulbifer sp. 2205BS26-8]|uniref:tyrosine-type recombinase/integrase n=1 Tax=Microbulbifer sp. 2205BS26-8 TaxID=3064386 RepID=UPI00273E1EA9|nr:tyrosine-type recombinase/integrase [Microbulbifer sp. 2205BS26-8]MDP5208878.1 tyrosine-type recombinase/integrase [Microbulbifer sp. 2205BS26-8]